MRMIKQRLIEKILPVWARSELQKEIERLRKQNQEKEAHIRQLDAYIDGLEYGIRNQRRIVINTGEVKK